MGHYHHIHYTLILKGLPDAIISMLRIQEDYYEYDRWANHTEAEKEERLKRVYNDIKNFEETNKNKIVGNFIKDHPIKWYDFLLYESNTFELIESVIEYPSGFVSNDIWAMHGAFDTKSTKPLKDFLEMIKPYLVSGAVWGWWESDASSWVSYL